MPFRTLPPTEHITWLAVWGCHQCPQEHYRKQKRMALTELGESVPGTETGPEQRLEEKQLRLKLLSAMEELTDDQQNVLALRFGYGMPIREVAEVIVKSEGSVKMLQARAIMALTQRLAVEGKAG
ncbi:MAG: sigma-70 family RNA polymerase sigma factor [Chloroflexota bacterium]